MISKKIIINSFKRIIFLFQETKKIEDIYNYYKVEGLYSTSGQPSKSDFFIIAEKNYEIIINLAPKSMIGKYILKEDKILNSLNIKYIHIPVNFNNPTEYDFEQFSNSITSNKNSKIWVHCVANMRVSAFTYKFKRDVLNYKHDQIINDLNAIWRPNKVWSDFLKLPQ